MRLNKYSRAFVIFLVIVIMLGDISLKQGWALSGEDHVEDMLSTLDVDDPLIENLCYDVTRGIDDYGQSVVKELNELGNFGSFAGNHRSLYHGGLLDENGRFSNPAKANEHVRKFLDSLSSEDRKKAEAIIDQGLKKIQKTIDDLMELNNIPISKRVAAKATIALLYDVHVLGDYETSNLEGLAPVSDLDNNIRGCLKRIMKGYPAELQKILDDLELIRDGSENDNKLYASRLRAYLKKAPLGKFFVAAGILTAEQVNIDGTIKESAFAQIERWFQGNAVARMYAKYAGFQSKYIPKDLRAPMNAGILRLLSSGLMNSYKVVKGDKEISQAVADVTEDVGTAATSQYVANALIQKIGGKGLRTKSWTPNRS